MNARYLISGILAAMLLLVGALLLVNGGGPEAATGGNQAVEAGAPAPARGEGGATDSNTAPDTLADRYAATAGLDAAADGSGPDAGTGPVAAAAERAGTGESASRGPSSDGSRAGESNEVLAAAVPGNDGRGSAVAGGEDAASSPQDPEVEAILRATSRRYEDVRSLQADFQQVINNPLLGRTTRSAGTLYQRQPDRFLMRFSDPEGDVVVSDGTYFWVYYPSVDPRQVMRSVRGAQGLDLRSQFIGDPTERFASEYHGTEEVRGRTTHVITLTPREALGYQRLKVWIDAGDHLVRRFELTEENSNVRRFELTDLRVNPALPDSLFEFEPPAGAHVVGGR